METNIRMRLFWLVLGVSCLPFILNLLGLDFASNAIPLDADKMVAGTISADDQFHALKGAMHHALLEWSAVSIAIFATLATFLHYYKNNDITVPIIGVALLCAGFTDAFHTLAATRILSASSPNTDFIPFTWAFSRIYNASVMAVGIIISLWVMRKSHSNDQTNLIVHSPRVLIIVSSVFIIIALLMMSVAASSENLPQTMFPAALITRPYDVVPLAMFTLVGALAWSWYKLSPSIIKFGLVLSLIPEIITQFHMSFGSTALFDNHFNIAHGLKIVAYSCILFGALFAVIKSSDVNKIAVQADDGSAIRNRKNTEGLLKIGTARRPQSITIPIAAFLLAMTVTILVSSLFYFDSERMVRGQEVEELRVQSKLVESLLTRLYQDTSADVQFLSRTPPIQGLIKSIRKKDKLNYELWRDRLEQIYSEVLLSRKSYVQIRYIRVTDSAQELVNVLTLNNTVYRVPKSRLQKIDEDNLLKNTLALLPGQVHFSKIELKRERGKVALPHQAVLAIATPIYDQVSDEIFGVVVILADFGDFINTLKQQSLSDIQLYISNTLGDFIYHPESSKTFGFDLGFDSTMQIEFPELADKIYKNIKYYSLLDSSKHTKSREESDHSGAGFYSVVNLQKHDQDHIMRLFLTYDHEKINSLLTNFRNRGLLLGLALAVIALSLAVLASRRLTFPLIQTIKAIEFYDRTEKLLDLPINSKDEVGVLARSISNMVLQKEQKERDLVEMQFAMDQHAIISKTDEKGIITYVNDKFLDVSGYAREELMGKDHRILNSGFHGKLFFQSMYKSICNGEVWRNEICNRAKDGHYYWVDSTMVPLIGEDGKPVSYISIRTDISERKQIELELQEAKDNALAAVKTKSEFLASMSHEIRTPMNGVLGMLGLLANTKLDKDQLHRVQIAQSSGEALLSLINDILDFSKIEADKIELEAVDFDLRKMLGEFSESMAYTAQPKGLELVLDIVQIDESMVRGDSSRLRQVLTNLVGNSIKFTAQGEIVLRVEIAHQQGNALRIVFYISDTGIGIPEEKLATLFDSFSQVDASTTRKFGGTGLGLSIAKKLSILMGGDMSVESVLDKGSIFRFSVMFEKSSQSEPVLPKFDIKNIKLLIVDDSVTNSDVLKQQLEHWGASVTVANSGAQALQIIDEIKSNQSPLFDLCFIDMQMPGMGGIELGEKIVSDGSFSEMKLIMMTSMGLQDNLNSLLESGFSAYFPKPATTADLFNALSVLSEGGDALILEKRDNSEQTGSIDGELGEDNWPVNTRILLVEDNHVNQLVAQGVLKTLGLQSEVANNGVEALQCLNQNYTAKPYTLILMDCQMPEMDGYEATQSIRAGNGGGNYSDIPIIAMTANAMQGDKDKCLNSGMSDYLTKPIDAEKLLNKLKFWLNSKHGEEAAESINRPIDNVPIKADEILVWDRSAALNRLLGKEDLLNTVIEIFKNENPGRVAEMQDAIEKGDCELAYKAAHSMKGVASNLSALQLEIIAKKLEKSAKNDNIDEVKELFSELKIASERFLKEADND